MLARSRSRHRVLVIALALCTAFSSSISSAVATTGNASSAPAHVAPTETVVPTATTERISGVDRYGTSVAASKAAFTDGDHPPVVYLVTGVAFPDAVSAGAVAAHVGGGLLLTESTRLSPVIAQELRRLNPDRIVVVGGPGAISDTVLAAAELIAPSTRVFGLDRYATADALVRSAFEPDGARHVLLATGTAFPDALTAVPAAASVNSPIVLVRGDQSRLDPTVLSLLESLEAERVTLVGGSGVISAGIQNQLTALLGAENVDRAWGADRYSTAQAVSTQFFGSHPGRVFVAAGTSFPDALAVSALAAQQNAPLYLSLPYCVPDSVRLVIGATTVAQRVLVGGPGALSPGVARLQSCLSIDSPSSPWVLVNKRNSLPSSYVPAGLRTPSVPMQGTLRLTLEAARALEQMVGAARTAGAGRIGLASAYRSFSSQSSIYASSVRSRGLETTDLFVARPGHSEHQTGLAADLYPIAAAGCSSYRCIGSTSQGRWLRDNAWRFGFVLRYEEGYTSITGFGSEPWHFRFIGTTLAADYRASGHRTFEQFLGQPAAPNY